MGLRFKRTETTTPELLLVPFIDVMLVLVIFMALNATFSRYAQLQVELPQAQGQAGKDAPRTLWIQVNAQSQIMLEGQTLGRMNATELARKLAPLNNQPNDPPMVVIGADARTPHQAVVVVMEAARMAGLSKITFMANQPGRRS